MKISAENAVGILEKRFFHDLEERRYFSLEQLIEDLWEKMDEMNNAPVKKKEHCYSYYWAAEKKELMLLPSAKYYNMLALPVLRIGGIPIGWR